MALTQFLQPLKGCLELTWTVLGHSAASVSFVQKPKFSFHLSETLGIFFNLYPTVQRNVRIVWDFLFGGVCVLFCLGFFNRWQCISFHSAVTAEQLDKALMPAQEKSNKVGFQCQR